jgi:hypothetical protein
MATSPAETNAELLRQILAELKQLTEVMEAFTNDGFPLARTIPTTETLAAMVVAAALISRGDPRVNPQDLQNRLAAAPVVSTQLIAHIDAYLQSVQVQQLDQLARQVQPPQPGN